jgi:Predicted signal transduction protein with a C-terminal ATPase domain
LQPLVENAVRHGIAPRAAAGHIDISASRQNGMLRIRISDDGPGLPKGQTTSAKEGVGISNTRARLAQLYGDNQRFDLIAGDKNGLIVNLEVPFRIDRNSNSAERNDDSSSDSRRRTVGA